MTLHHACGVGVGRGGGFTRIKKKTGEEKMTVHHDCCRLLTPVSQHISSPLEARRGSREHPRGMQLGEEVIFVSLATC